mmetsp:Transcript_1168/g.3504  ORF Transcript_1168/g.3504 Transcript_1168/m.3504 type:complete len:221 (+) Transcript_1168:1237-1899(+)
MGGSPGGARRRERRRRPLGVRGVSRRPGPVPGRAVPRRGLGHLAPRERRRLQDVSVGRGIQRQSLRAARPRRFLRVPRLPAGLPHVRRRRARGLRRLGEGGRRVQDLQLGRRSLSRPLRSRGRRGRARRPGATVRVRVVSNRVPLAIDVRGRCRFPQSRRRIQDVRLDRHRGRPRPPEPLPRQGRGPTPRLPVVPGVVRHLFLRNHTRGLLPLTTWPFCS